MRDSRRIARRRIRPTAGIAALVWFLLLPQFATASVLIQNYIEGGVAVSSTGPRFFAYHQGVERAFDVDADFDQGTYVDTEVDGSGTAIRLAGAGAIAWWDTDWGSRRCFDVTNNDNILIEHQVRVSFDSTLDLANGLVQPDGADYRAIAADDTTELDLFVESGVGTADTVVWVQLDLAAFTTTRFCLYFDNATALSVSSEAETFSYLTQRELYYPAYWRFDGSTGNNGTLDIVSYVDNNNITIDGVNVMLDAGDTAVFTNITEDSTILSTGPLGGRGRGNGMDHIVPARFAGTTMIFPTNRSTQQWTLLSPSGATANVQIFNGTTLAWSGTVGGTTVSPVADVGNNNSGIVRSDVPIIVTHTSPSNSFADSQVVPPVFPGDDIYGVRSRGVNIGFDTAGSVEVWGSDLSITTVAGGGGSSTQIYDGTDLDGNGTAMRFTNMVGAVGGIQQADRDGWESTAFLPETLLDNEYYLPSDAQYIAFACPVSMNIVVGATSFPCGSAGPGFPGHLQVGFTGAGTRIASDSGEPFYAYYEDNRNQDETNLLGMKSAWAPEEFDVTFVELGLEQLPTPPTTGTWTSPAIDTAAGTGSDVFGLLSTIATVPTDTDITFQVSRGATAVAAAAGPFVGPDNTAATSFGVGQTPISYDFDFGDGFVAIRATLTAVTPGDSPTLDLVRLGWDLPEVSQSSLHVVETNGPTVDRDWILRVWTEDPVLVGADATLVLSSASGLGAASDLDLSLDAGTQVVFVGGVLVQASGTPVAIGPGFPHSVVADTQTMAGANVDVVWQGRLAGTGILITHELLLSFL